MFVMVNAGDLKGRMHGEREDDSCRLRGQRTARGIAKSPVPPSFIVESKRGPHFYFKVIPETPLDAFEPLQGLAV